MTPQSFIAKWQAATLSERSACQQHFLDLCDLLSQEKPAAADPEGAWYCFERGVRTTEGGQGWADVWKKDHFGWEYKGKHKDLAAAYKQLQRYRESLENPRPQNPRSPAEYIVSNSPRHIRRAPCEKTFTFVRYSRTSRLQEANGNEGRERNCRATREKAGHWPRFTIGGQRKPNHWRQVSRAKRRFLVQG